MKKNDKPAASCSKNEKSKRKLDFEKKKKPGLLVLSKKVFYLDIKDSRQMRSLEGKLKQLGGTVEKFLSKEINYIITSNELSRKRTDKNGGMGDSPNPTNASTPSPFNLGQSPSPNSGAEIKKIENVPRGKALAKIASGQKSPNTILENAEKIGIKVVSYEQSIKYVEKEIAKLKTVSETSKQATKKKSSTSRNKVQALKSPFIKYESEMCQYRPVVQELDAWPHLNVETARGTCPFDGRPLGHAQRSEKDDMNAEKIMPNTPRGEGLNTPNTPQEVKNYKSCRIHQEVKDLILPILQEVKKMCGRVNDESTSKLLGFPILTVGEIKRERERKRKAARRQGYCEACKEKYNDIDQHLLGDRHKQFVRNKANFQNLDRLIASGSSTAAFISSVILRHCVLKAKEKPKCEGNDEIVLYERKHPEESGFKIEHMQTPKKNVLPLRVEQNLDDSEDCGETNKSRKNLGNTFMLQPLHMIELSQICPKHKKDRSLCKCTVKLSSLGKQLAQNCSPRRSIVQSCSPNSSVKRLGDTSKIKLHSAMVITNSHRRLYDSPTRSNMRTFRKTSKQEMVIGNSQIASLQTVESVYNPSSNIQPSSDLDSTEPCEEKMSEIKFKPNEADDDKSENDTLSTFNNAAKQLTMQPVKDGKAQCLTRPEKVQKLSFLSDCHTKQKYVVLDKGSVEKKICIPFSLDVSSNVNSYGVPSKDSNSSSVLTKNVTDHSLPVPNSVVVMVLDKDTYEVLSKHQSARPNRKSLSIPNEKQFEEKRSPVKSNVLKKSVEKIEVNTKGMCKDFNKSKDLVRSSLSKISNENAENNNLLFCQSAAERVKNRRSKSSSSTPKSSIAGSNTPRSSSVAGSNTPRSSSTAGSNTPRFSSIAGINTPISSIAGSNTPSGSICDENISENDRSRIFNSNQTKTSGNGVCVGRSQKQKSGRWSGTNSKPDENENNSISHSGDCHNVQKAKSKKRLAKLKLYETEMNNRVEGSDNVQCFNGSVSVNQKDAVKTEFKEELMQKELKGISLGSESPKYKKRSKKVDSKSKLDKKESNSSEYKSSSPVFKRSPHYCKKSSVPVSPIPFNINTTETVMNKKTDHRLTIRDITQHNGFLRMPVRIAGHIQLNDDMKCKVKEQAGHLKDVNKGEQSNLEKVLSSNTTKEIEDDNKTWDSPKSGYSTTPRGKHLARRKLHSNLNKPKGNGKRKLKYQEKETNYDAKKKSSEKLKLCGKHDGSSLEFDASVSSQVKHSVSKDIHKEQNVEKKSVLSLNAKNCIKGNETSLCISSFCATTDSSGNMKKRKWGANTSTSSKPGLSIKKVKLNRSWLILSERSIGKLLESETDAPPFHGYNGHMLESNLPSDMTYEELSEVEVSDDSDKEWIIEDYSNSHDVDNKSEVLEEQEFNKFVPLLTSPGKATDSSWDHACDSFLKTTYDKLSASHSCSTPFNGDAKQSKKKNKKSKRKGKKGTKLKHQSDASDVIQMSDHINDDRRTPLKERKQTELDCGVEQIDEDIVFNFCSPQKNKREFSPLRKEDTYRFVDNQCNVSSARYKISYNLEQVSSPVKKKNKGHKKKPYSLNDCKSASKATKSVHSEFEHVKRTPSKSRRETFS